ncbi:MAG TPA: ChbG/HpnK family deacetylase [Acidimicrobiales bacterium]|nr:ChbG/HpnK family deacetylase [Acidimicrobiales bacterium]
MTSLLSRLGLGARDRALIVTADDFGLCHAATEGVLDALGRGAATSAGLVVPAPWALEAASRAGGHDVGVHLALTAGLPRFRWGPVTFAPSLLGGDGGFPATTEDLHDHADPDEVRRECRAQLERAVLLGVGPTHLSVLGDALFAAPALFDVLVELAAESGLPLRLPGRADASRFGFPLYELVDDAGVARTDHVRHSAPGILDDPAGFAASLLGGVTELVVRPARDTDELHALAPDADERVRDLGSLVGEGSIARALDDAGVVTLSWSVVRDLTPSPSVPAR